MGIIITEAVNRFNSDITHCDTALQVLVNIYPRLIKLKKNEFVFDKLYLSFTKSFALKNYCTRNALHTYTHN